MNTERYEDLPRLVKIRNPRRSKDENRRVARQIQKNRKLERGLRRAAKGVSF